MVDIQDNTSESEAQFAQKVGKSDFDLLTFRKSDRRSTVLFYVIFFRIFVDVLAESVSYIIGVIIGSHVSVKK